jgi:hypothetical protein
MSTMSLSVANRARQPDQIAGGWQVPIVFESLVDLTISVFSLVFGGRLRMNTALAPVRFDAGCHTLPAKWFTPLKKKARLADGFLRP